MGIELPRTTYYQCLQGSDVDFDDLATGDLLFFVNVHGEAGHVAVYLGKGCYIEAPDVGDVVKVTSMTEKMPTFAKRIVALRPATSASGDAAVALDDQPDQAASADEASEHADDSASALFNERLLSLLLGRRS